MRWIATALASALAAGCTGYTIDYIRPKTFLIGPQLSRYGLDASDRRCVGERLGGSLKVHQLRRLATAAGALNQGYADPGRLTLSDLLWVARNAEDKDLSPALVQAVEACGLADAVAARRVDLPDLPPPTPKPPAAAGPENGPRGYQPSEALWSAIEAYERREFVDAARLAALAASQGDSGAHQFLGGLYAAGQGVPADPGWAARHYRLAAEAGWSEAMNNLGKAYETGQGVARDPVEALKWYLLASARPTEDAELVARNLQAVSGILSPEELAAAATRAREWEQTRRR